MKSNILISINKITDIDKYAKVGINTFLFALDGFCAGYENTFDVETINQYPNSYVLINRILDCESIDALKKILPQLQVKGIVYEDVGVFNIVKNAGYNFELIFFQNHFGTNKKSINFWLKQGVESVFVSNELTMAEIESITKEASKPVVVQVLGYNQVMYSRRSLLSNYHDNFQLPRKYVGIIDEISSHVKFRVLENAYGTVVFSEKVFNGLELQKLNNVKYFYINTNFLTVDEVLGYLEGSNTDCDQGFLNKKALFKLKGGKV